MSESRRGMRIGLAVLTVPSVLTGAWALFAPASWYASYGPKGATPSLFGPYNEHFVQDLGGGFLAIGVVLLFALVRTQRDVVRAALLAFFAFTLPHFAVHLVEQSGLSDSGFIFINVSLGASVVLAAWLWRLTSRLP